MEKLNSKKEISFGISIEEIERRAQHTYDTVVRPQVELEKSLRDKGLLDEKPVLSDVYKIYASCQSLI